MSQHTPGDASDAPHNTVTPRKKVVQGEKLRGADKVARIPVKVIPTTDLPRKPALPRRQLRGLAIQIA